MASPMKILSDKKKINIDLFIIEMGTFLLDWEQFEIVSMFEVIKELEMGLDLSILLTRSKKETDLYLTQVFFDPAR